MAKEPVDPRHSFEEFKLYYESTEKVTDRRLDTNRWNYSICIATMAAIAVLIKWTLSGFQLVWIGFAGVAVLSGMAILFCFLWVGQIRDFKKLNNAKFTVLNEMAPRIEFDPENPGAVVSFCPFEKEWNRLRSLDALDEVGRTNIIALKSSNVEYFIPRAFAALFIGILATLIVILAMNWPPTKLIQASKSPATTESRRSQP